MKRNNRKKIIGELILNIGLLVSIWTLFVAVVVASVLFNFWVLIGVFIATPIFAIVTIYLISNILENIEDL